MKDFQGDDGRFVRSDRLGVKPSRSEVNSTVSLTNVWYYVVIFQVYPMVILLTPIATRGQVHKIQDIRDQSTLTRHGNT